MIQVILIIILICFSAFFSGTEIAYTSVNRVRLQNLADNGSRVAKRAIKIRDNFDNTLTCILVGNNFVNIAASSVTTTIAYALARDLGSENMQSVMVTAATAIITILILIFGEITPKVICKQNSERMVLLCAYPATFFIIIFAPISFIVSGILKLLSKLWGTPDDSVTEQELATIIETAEEEGGIDEDKSDLLQNALEFSDISLVEIITHRKDLIALDINASAEENLRVINASRYSRLPVYKGSIDNIVGILNINHFYKKNAQDPSLTVGDIMLPPTFMHSAVKLTVALEQMREGKIQMVVVLDEYGGTFGIVTMEDILEELVGEIWDEYDEVEEDFEELGENVYDVDGSASVDDFCDLF
ncbi:MAG: HlyC/CorC family transporter, partial [Clostridia bacterium]|nr:HlyC/CorC family transporter [Clostridia bacterium]